MSAIDNIFVVRPKPLPKYNRVAHDYSQSWKARGKTTLWEDMDSDRIRHILVAAMKGAWRGGATFHLKKNALMQVIQAAASELEHRGQLAFYSCEFTGHDPAFVTYTINIDGCELQQTVYL